MDGNCEYHVQSYTAFSNVLTDVFLKGSNAEEIMNTSISTSPTTAIFITAASKPPYNAYGTPFFGNASCGNVISVTSHGVLSEVIQNYTYSPTSGVHGLAFNPDYSFLYSADDSGNAVWTHSVDEISGKLEFVEHLPGPQSGADPRHMVVHPNGSYAYVIFEGTNQVAVYNVAQKTQTLAFTNISYPLIPSGMEHNMNSFVPVF
jgi:carboxy-cis,cis-muconate cyclase